MNYEILLQGFHWDSHNVQGKRWYRIIEENADRIKKSGFTIVWFPPPSDSVDRQGYIPRELNKLESNYGNEVELKASIAKLSPVQAIADIVINHRAGKFQDADFKNPDWDPAETVVRYDEGSGPESFTPDTGDGVHFARDLNHKSSIVSLGIKDWMNSLKQPVGYVGWRYDLVKGYSPWATELYNRETKPTFSVGEY